MDTNSLIILLANVALLVVVSIVLAYRQRYARKEIDRNKTEIHALRSELSALYAGAAGVGSQLARIESRLSTLSERQDQVEGSDFSTTVSYNQAIEMVHQGANVEQLMASCGLLREEAELLIQLHRQDAAGPPTAP